MELIDYFRRQVAYNEWANHEVLTALKSSSNAARSVQLMAHILSAERLWLERLTLQRQSFPVWPEFDLKQCQAQVIEVGSAWRHYLHEISPSQLSQTVPYKNTKGEPWCSSIQDVLTHVLMHSAYHRGQIAREMRTNGQTPAYTDFIHAARQGLIK